MRLKFSIITIIFVIFLQACSSGSSSPRAVDAPAATNPGGTPVTAVFTARFDASAGVIPFPTNLLLSGTKDLTLNIPVDNPDDASNPQNALNALDGFSTVAPWSASFSSAVKANTVLPGQTVRLFQVKLTQPGGGVVAVEAELTPGVDYVAVANGAAVAIVPLKPLKEITSYMAVLTNGLTDAQGNIATADQQYFIAKRTSPLVDADGNSTDPLLNSDSAARLEPLRQLVNSQEAAAASQGINPSDIVLSWVATTQSIQAVLKAAKAQSGPNYTAVGPTGLTTSVVEGAGIADIWIGVQSSPYYLSAPTAENPTAPLNTPWSAAPGAYVAPFNQLGLDPTSTNLTFANPFPVATSTQTYPTIMTLPNANSGHTKPASGWPIVIFQHGITRNRTDMLAIADTMASIGYAVIAQDLALHGITDTTNPFYVENTPFAPLASERTFDVDYINNETGAPGPDNVIDSSAAHFINLGNLLVSRDNFRQGVADLFTLAASIPRIDYDQDGVPDFDGSRIAYVSLSLGSITGGTFLALEDTVTNGVLSVGGGGIARLLDGSQTFGPRIRAGLQAAGIDPTSAQYQSFMLATQTVVDSGDPINYAATAGASNNILFHEVLGDTVVPNTVSGAPLSGSEPLAAMMGLPTISATTQNAGGVDGIVRFTAGGHGSLLNPSVSAPTTVEMQTQMASFVGSGGTAVIVTDESVIQGQQ